MTHFNEIPKILTGVIVSVKDGQTCIGSIIIKRKDNKIPNELVILSLKSINKNTHILENPGYIAFWKSMSIFLMTSNNKFQRTIWGLVNLRSGMVIIEKLCLYNIKTAKEKTVMEETGTESTYINAYLKNFKLLIVTLFKYWFRQSFVILYVQ